LYQSQGWLQCMRHIAGLRSYVVRIACMKLLNAKEGRQGRLGRRRIRYCFALCTIGRLAEITYF